MFSYIYDFKISLRKLGVTCHPGPKVATPSAPGPDEHSLTFNKLDMSY
jgi:hypothetical protein